MFDPNKPVVMKCLFKMEDASQCTWEHKGTMDVFMSTLPQGATNGTLMIYEGKGAGTQAKFTLCPQHVNAVMDTLVPLERKAIEDGK